MSFAAPAFAYVGNWSLTAATPLGFGICRYETETGALALIKSVFPQINVGGTCLDARRRILYCTNEVATHPGYHLGGGGQVFALALDPVTGDLSEINHQPSYGVQPGYVTLDDSGRYLLATNHSGHMPITRSVREADGRFRIVLEYDDATTVLYPLGENGAIGDPCDIYKHTGRGLLAKQSHPHPHSVVMSPSGRLFAVCDKGSDQIVLLRIDRVRERLEVCGGRAYPAIPGSSPRYSVFHPRLPYFFMNNETKAVVCAFRYDEDGRLCPLGQANALPEGYEDGLTMMQSDLRLHPNGRILYDLIRGIHAVSVFAIDEQTGGLTRIQTVTLEGTGPRGCSLSPDGRFLHIAALTSKEVLVWAIGADGRLSPTGRRFSHPSPSSITFFPP